MKLVTVYFFASQLILRMNGTWIVLARYPDINASPAPNQSFDNGRTWCSAQIYLYHDVCSMQVLYLPASCL